MNCFPLEECCVCLEGKPEVIFNPCLHKCCCNTCNEQIQKAKLECPLCRSPIESVVEHSEVVITEVPKEVWEDFQNNHRKQYVARFAARANALFVGNSALARAARTMATDALDERRKETEGGERCMSKNKTTDLQDGKLVVTYKVGRKTRREEYDIEDGEVVPGSDEEDLELATHNPKMYWLRLHNKNKKLKV